MEQEILARIRELRAVTDRQNERARVLLSGDAIIEVGIRTVVESFAHASTINMPLRNAFTK